MVKSDQPPKAVRKDGREKNSLVVYLGFIDSRMEKQISGRPSLGAGGYGQIGAFPRESLGEVDGTLDDFRIHL